MPVGFKMKFGHLILTVLQDVGTLIVSGQKIKRLKNLSCQQIKTHPCGKSIALPWLF